MIINFKKDSMMFKSNWLDEGGKMINVVRADRGKNKDIRYDAFLLYITLYRFYSYDPTTKDIYFHTSIYHLKKQTGFTKERTYDLVKLLEKHKLIKTDVTNWTRYTDKELMIITALDLPVLTKKESGKCEPIDEDNYYVSIDLPLIQKMIDENFSTKEIVLYCLIRKMSNNVEVKSWMAIEKMSSVLSISTDTITKMIRKLNKYYVIASYYRSHKQRGKDGIRFEHHPLDELSHIDEFKKLHGKTIESNIKKWDKKQTCAKKVVSAEVDVESLDDVDYRLPF